MINKKANFTLPVDWQNFLTHFFNSSHFYLCRKLDFRGELKFTKYNSGCYFRKALKITSIFALSHFEVKFSLLHISSVKHVTSRLAYLKNSFIRSKCAIYICGLYLLLFFHFISIYSLKYSIYCKTTESVQ